MNIVRELEQIIKNKLYQKKAIVVVGPRQIGKTTLLNQIYEESDRKILFLNCDEPDVRIKLDLPTSTLNTNFSLQIKNLFMYLCFIRLPVNFSDSFIRKLEIS